MPGPQKQTINEVLDEFLAEQRPRLAARTFRTDETIFDLLKRHPSSPSHK